MEKSLQRLKALDRELRHLGFAIAVLGWDQETYMPDQAVEGRSEQIALLEGIAHQKGTSSEIGKLFEDLGVTEDNPLGNDSLSDFERSFLRELFRDYNRLRKLPERLVTEMARETSIAQSVWVRARKESDFQLFAPNLEKVLSLVREAAEHFGYNNHIYDALIDEFEPGMKTAELEDVFTQLESKLAPLASQIAAEPQVRADFLHQEFPRSEQEAFGRKILSEIGYDFSRGRIDVSAHPFSTTLGISDSRLTTRYDEGFLNTSIFGTIHEAGHGMYEQGFSQTIRGTVLGQGTSLGIHESQSRSWENIIGRSLPFWKHFYPDLKRHFPGRLDDVSLLEFYRGINRVEPSLIRVEADEVTYSLHIILRFSLELKMISGEVAVKDLPELWNARMNELLGIVPSSNDDGVLQDIHWSMGGIGYFPTYALGNLYGAQFANRMKKDLRDLNQQIERGEFAEILAWQRKHIHTYGRLYTAAELCQKCTGESLNPDYFVEYLAEKFSSIYGL